MKRLISRDQAREIGKNKFFTGEPCKHGHEVERYVGNQACVQCVKIRNSSEKVREQQRGYVKNNIEKVLESQRRWKENNPNYHSLRREQNLESERLRLRISVEKWRKNNPNKVKEYDAARYLADPEKFRNIRKNKYKENPETEREKVKIWRQENPEKVKVQWANRRAKEKQAEGSFSDLDVEALFNWQKYLCVGCNVSLENTEYHVDHILPLSLGGSNWPWNLQILCARCNLSKGAKHPDEWVKPKFKCDSY